MKKLTKTFVMLFASTALLLHSPTDAAAAEGLRTNNIGDNSNYDAKYKDLSDDDPGFFDSAVEILDNSVEAITQIKKQLNRDRNNNLKNKDVFIALRESILDFSNENGRVFTKSDDLRQKNCLINIDNEIISLDGYVFTIKDESKNLTLHSFLTKVLEPLATFLNEGGNGSIVQKALNKESGRDDLLSALNSFSLGIVQEGGKVKSIVFNPDILPKYLQDPYKQHYDTVLTEAFPSYAPISSPTHVLAKNPTIPSKGPEDDSGGVIAGTEEFPVPTDAPSALGSAASGPLSLIYSLSSEELSFTDDMLPDADLSTGDVSQELKVKTNTAYNVTYESQNTWKMVQGEKDSIGYTFKYADTAEVNQNSSIKSVTFGYAKDNKSIKLKYSVNEDISNKATGDYADVITVILAPKSS